VPAHLPGLRFGGAFEPTPVNPESTIMDRLDAAGLSWKLYGASRSQNGYIWSICPSFAQCLDTRQDANLVPDAQFTADAALGVLPAFSVVTPGGPDYLNGCHNAMSITACGNWVGQLVGAVEHGPDWRSTAVFITWDDCGCFYDQVRPGVNPDGTAQGPRVPLIIVSPYARPRLHRHHRDHVRRDPRLHRAHLRPVRAGGQRRRVLVRQGLQLRPATTQTGAHDPPPAPRIGQAHSSHPFPGERPDLIRPRSLGAGGRVLPAV
jgi:hypothetical protein